jgi:hypothetical protein
VLRVGGSAYEEGLAVRVSPELPTKNVGKFIADYVREDREHLGVELRSWCRELNKRTRARGLRELAWAAVENIEYAWEGTFRRVAQRDIVDAARRLESRCRRRTSRQGGRK